MLSEVNKINTNRRKLLKFALFSLGTLTILPVLGNLQSFLKPLGIKSNGEKSENFGNMKVTRKSNQLIIRDESNSEDILIIDRA